MDVLNRIKSHIYRELGLKENDKEKKLFLSLWVYTIFFISIFCIVITREFLLVILFVPVFVTAFLGLFYRLYYKVRLSEDVSLAITFCTALILIMIILMIEINVLDLVKNYAHRYSIHSFIPKSRINNLIVLCFMILLNFLVFYLSIYIITKRYYKWLRK